MNNISSVLRAENFARFARFVVAYNVLVIIWGAFVRASKSGDGCGSHYPLCNGEVVPLNPTVSTLIEFSHRVSSGLDGILVLIMLVWAFIAFRGTSAVRVFAVLSFIFILIEAAIGAFLVKFEWVAGNVSMNRAVFLSVHLANTLILLLVLTLTAWLAGGSRISWRGNERRAAGFGFALVLMLLVGMSGAVAALGNTLFPGHELARGLEQSEHSLLLQIFLWLQLWHPFLAIVASLFTIALAQPLRTARNDDETRRWAFYTLVLVAAQIGFGAANQIFLAPIWMQLVHLLLADFLWIALVLLAASAMKKTMK